MAKVFECRAGGVPCGFTATGDSEDEVLAEANEHAVKVHHLDLTQNATLERYARSLVHDDTPPEADKEPS